MSESFNEVVDLDSEVSEINESQAHLVQVHNISYRMVMINENCYLLSRAFALVNPMNEYVIDLLQRRVIICIPARVAKVDKLPKTHNKSRNKVKKEVSKEQEKVMSGLSQLFSDDNQNVRQTR